jgi:uncharacterized protein YecT (DUF1311 family)
MKLCIITGLLLILVINFAFGQDIQTNKHPIDLKTEQCLSIDSNQSTFGMINCIRTAMEEWDAELNKYYNLLMDTLSIDEQEKLRAAQRKWLEFRDKEFVFIETMHGNMEGTMWKIVEADSHNNIVRKRALELTSYYNTLILE